MKLEIKQSGITTQRLIVYPKVMHFPKQDQPHQIAFQLVGFDKDPASSAISMQLEDLEFKLSGLWQFIPVCRVPVISVFRNFDEAIHQNLKKLDETVAAKKKVNFMKATHVPLIWKDAPFKPFRFNPKLEKEEQGRPLFLQLKAKFIPAKDGFEFVALLAPPLEKAPKFFKASNDDKATVQKQKKKKATPSKANATPISAKEKQAKQSKEKSKPKPRPVRELHKIKSAKNPQAVARRLHGQSPPARANTVLLGAIASDLDDLFVGIPLKPNQNLRNNGMFQWKL